MNVRPPILVITSLLGSWLGMQVVHELGHVIGAIVSGGHVSCVVLHPLTISRTDVSVNPHPLLVVWAGPLLGCMLPLGLWGIAIWLRLSEAFLARFFAGFCLIANGLYIGIGAFDRVGDCGEMLKHGSPIWGLWLYGSIATPLGLLIWHRQGGHFGWGSEGREIRCSSLIVSVSTCLALILLGLVVGEC